MSPDAAYDDLEFVARSSTGPARELHLPRRKVRHVVEPDGKVGTFCCAVSDHRDGATVGNLFRGLKHQPNIAAQARLECQ